MRTLIFASLLGILSISTANGASKTLRIVADEWCPVSCSAHSDKRGYAVDIMDAVLKAEGLKSTYETIAWAKALEGTKTGTYDIVLGATEGELDDAVQPKEEIGVSVNVFFTAKNSSWRFKGIESLNNKSLAIVDGYAYGNPLDDYIDKNRNRQKNIYVVDSSDPVNAALRLVTKNSVQVYIEDRTVLRWNAIRNLQGNVQEAGEYSRRPLFALFSTKNPKSRQIASAFDQRIQQMRRSGELKRILSKYGMEDWK